MPPELQELLEGLSAFQIFIWCGLIVGLGVGAYRAWPVFSRFVATVNALADLPEFMERIRHQVENDHDTNLRDEVTQLLDMTSDMGDQLAGVVDWQEKHERKSDAAYARITTLEQKENR